METERELDGQIVTGQRVVDKEHHFVIEVTGMGSMGFRVYINEVRVPEFGQGGIIYANDVLDRVEIAIKDGSYKNLVRRQINELIDEVAKSSHEIGALARLL